MNDEDAGFWENASEEEIERLAEKDAYQQRHENGYA